MRTSNIEHRTLNLERLTFSATGRTLRGLVMLFCVLYGLELRAQQTNLVTKQISDLPDIGTLATNDWFLVEGVDHNFYSLYPFQLIPSGLVTNFGPSDVMVTNAGVGTDISSNSVTTTQVNAGGSSAFNVLTANNVSVTNGIGLGGWSNFVATAGMVFTNHTLGIGMLYGNDGSLTLSGNLTNTAGSDYVTGGGATVTVASNAVTVAGSGVSTVITSNSVTTTGTVTAGMFAGSGGGVTNLNATNVNVGLLSPQVNPASGASGYGVPYNYTYVDATVIGSPFYTTNQYRDWHPNFQGSGGGPIGYLTNYMFFGGGNWCQVNGVMTVTNGLTSPGDGAYVEWDQLSTNVLFGIKGSAAFWQLLVDGIPEPPNRHFNETIGANGDMWVYMYQLAPTLDQRYRHIELHGSKAFSFEALFAPTNEGVGYSAVHGPTKKVVIIGDSWIDGPGNIGDYFNFRFADHGHRNLDVIQCAVGGTGYINPGPGSPATNYVNHIIDINSYHADYIIITGSVNDPVVNGTMNPSYASNWSMTNATTNLYLTIMSNNPTAKLFVMGPWNNVTTGPNNLNTVWTNDLIISNACASLNIPYCSSVFPYNQIFGNYQTGAGNTGNFIYPSGASMGHPTASGSEYLGNALADAFLNAYPDADTPKPINAYLGTAAQVITNPVVPAPIAGSGLFVASNYDLYWVTPPSQGGSGKTNLITLGH